MLITSKKVFYKGYENYNEDNFHNILTNLALSGFFVLLKVKKVLKSFNVYIHKVFIIYILLKCFYTTVTAKLIVS